LHRFFTESSKIERDETDVSMSRLQQIAKELGVSVKDLMEFGEGISNSFNKNKGTNTVICSPDAQDMLIELTRLKTENEGLKREMARLEKIISLLEEKHAVAIR
jgi:transcriptional regulator with XRE-family HTH domain